MTYRAGRIVPHPEAFSRLRPRQPRRQSGDHLKFIRSLPCVVCLSRAKTQAAHIRSASLVYGKRGTGVGEKSSDRFCNPLCPEHHAEQHRGNELAFWQSYGIDPFQVATALYACSGEDEPAETIIRMARART